MIKTISLSAATVFCFSLASCNSHAKTEDRNDSYMDADSAHSTSTMQRDSVSTSTVTHSSSASDTTNSADSLRNLK